LIDDARHVGLLRPSLKHAKIGAGRSTASQCLRLGPRNVPRTNRFLLGCTSMTSFCAYFQRTSPYRLGYCCFFIRCCHGGVSFFALSQSPSQLVPTSHRAALIYPVCDIAVIAGVFVRRFTMIDCNLCRLTDTFDLLCSKEIDITGGQYPES